MRCFRLVPPKNLTASYATATAHQGVRTLGLIVLHQAIASLFRFSVADLVSCGP